ncbi:AMP-binding enzyme [Chryseobacterium tongliaoense]|uniref:AMP-binding enzyme n=1 Tax=Chryseobacterium tongliaoense TaxID=3240933 RepID=UPI0035161CA6
MAAAIGSPDKRVGEMPVVFVQLRPNQQVSAEELKTFAQENIAEKAAIPKEIFIVEAIPLTAVGKIFKPELTQIEIKRVFSNELKSISEIENFEINVDQTPQWGMVAQIITTGKNPDIIAEKVKEALGNYTVKYQLK